MREKASQAMNPSDLTGRDLDLAVARALGYVWWEGKGGVSYQRDHEHPPEGFVRVDAPGPEYGSPWLPGYDCDGGRIPELFAEIRRHAHSVRLIAVDEPSTDYLATCTRKRGMGAGATGSTPNEALARLLLMVAQPVP